MGAKDPWCFQRNSMQRGNSWVLLWPSLWSALLFLSLFPLAGGQSVCRQSTDARNNLVPETFLRRCMASCCHPYSVDRGAIEHCSPCCVCGQFFFYAVVASWWQNRLLTEPPGRGGLCARRGLYAIVKTGLTTGFTKWSGQ